MHLLLVNCKMTSSEAILPILPNRANSTLRLRALIALSVIQYEINVKETAVYTNVNGDIVSYTSKTAKIKNNTSLNVNVLLSNITFLIFAVFDV